MLLDHYQTIADAIVHVFYPLAEVIIHDLATGKICFIAGNISKKKVGDPSVIAADIHIALFSSEKITYLKLENETLIKSIAIPIWQSEEIVALVCLIVDISLLQKFNDLMKYFLPNNISLSHDVLSKDDWQDKLLLAIHAFLNDRGLHFHSIHNSQEKESTFFLYQTKNFNEKKAAKEIPKVFQEFNDLFKKVLPENLSSNLENEKLEHVILKFLNEFLLKKGWNIVQLDEMQQQEIICYLYSKINISE